MTAIRTGEWEGDVSQSEGVRASDPAQVQQLQAMGYTKCPTPSCDFWINPQAHAAIVDSGGYFTCPVCRRSADLMEGLPWHGVGPGPWGEAQTAAPGGNTIIGLPLADQAQIGENIVQGLKELPGYGPIVWWHPGNATSNSPLDGATADWGIEVKTLAYDSVHHRFIPGRVQEKQAKNSQAAELGLKGILGVLVLLDYRRDIADVYVKEMPLAGWQAGNRTIKGVAAFRSNTAQRLVAEVPFDSPYKDPSHPSPVQYSLNDYYQKPTPNNQPAAPTEDMPF